MRKLHMPYFQITAAAMNLYAAEGSKGVTMRRIAKTVGVSAAALYRHFENKDAILNEIAAEADMRLGEALRRPTRLPRKARRNRVAAVAERAAQFALRHPHLYELATQRKQKRIESDYNSTSIIRREVEAGVAAGQLNNMPPEWVARAVWAQLCGLGALRERGDLAHDPEVMHEQWISATDRLLYGLVRL